MHHVKYDTTPPSLFEEGSSNQRVNTPMELELRLADAPAQWEYTTSPRKSLSVASEWDDYQHGRDAPEPLDKPIQFIRDFHDLKQLRNNVQRLRIRAKDKRNQMKFTRAEVHKTSAKLLRSVELQQDIHEQVRSLQESVRELGEQEIVYDSLESQLIPAEWALKEAERELYEDVAGELALDQDESQVDAWSLPESLSRVPDAIDAMNTSSPPHELTAEERLAVLDSSNSQLRTRLEKLDNDYAAIAQNARMRAAAGVPLDDFSQEFIAAYPARRGDLMKGLAAISKQRHVLQSDFVITSRPVSPTGTLLRFDQFSGSDTDLRLQTWEHDDDNTLQLQDTEYKARKADLAPLLAHATLTNMKDVDRRMSTAGLEEDDYNTLAQENKEAVDDLPSFVSKWLCRCITASWWTVIRFAFQNYLDNRLSYTAMVKYVRDMWSRDEGLPVSRIGFVADLESVRTSKLPSSTVYEVSPFYNPEWQSRQQKRRHSSGCSGELRAKTHVTIGRRPNTE
jgi:myosin heavy subunit